mmetsp:Transcript_17797/g.46038  ORF Transcript_17797/g.46038 Transcript_17797/m.46038 type:complete len:230 (+) Transcript_17797:3-692(+)
MKSSWLMRAVPLLAASTVLLHTRFAVALVPGSSSVVRPLSLWSGVPRVRKMAIRMLAIDENKGFGDRPKPKQRLAETPASDGTAGRVPSPPAGSSKQPDADAVLARVGIKSDRPADVPLPSQEAPQDMPPEPGLLARLPMETQNQIEQLLFLAGGLAITSFIFIGFAVVYDSYAIVSKLEVPESVQGILDFLTPKFTPALGVTLLCSISLGLFKQAQLNEVDISYKEDD